MISLNAPTVKKVSKFLCNFMLPKSLKENATKPGNVIHLNKIYIPI
jgi:hypothetical protein